MLCCQAPAHQASAHQAAAHQAPKRRGTVLVRLRRSKVAFCHVGGYHAVWEILLVPTGALRLPVMHIHSPRSFSVDLLTIACRAGRLPATWNEALRLTPIEPYGTCLLPCARLVESYDGRSGVSGIRTAISHSLSPSPARSFPNSTSIFGVYVHG